MNTARLLVGLLVAPFGSVPIAYFATLVETTPIAASASRLHDFSTFGTIATVLVALSFLVELALLPLLLRLRNDGNARVPKILRVCAPLGGGAALLNFSFLVALVPYPVPPAVGIGVALVGVGLLGVACGSACGALFWFVALWTPWSRASSSMTSKSGVS